MFKSFLLISLNSKYVSETTQKNLIYMVSEENIFNNVAINISEKVDSVAY